MEELTGSIPLFPHTADLLATALQLSDGTVLKSEVGGSLLDARLMVRELGYDVCDLPIVNYLSAKDRGVAMTAIPVFPKRSYVQGMLFVNRETGVMTPNDLEGKRVGILYHGMTDVVWARGLLQDYYRVDCAQITWVTSNEEQIFDAILPPNVEHHRGAALNDMLVAGEIAGMVSGRRLDGLAPQVEPLLPDTIAAEKEWYAKTTIFPIFHTIAVKDSVLSAHPNLASELFNAFVASKQKAFDRLRGGNELTADETDAAHSSGFPTSLLPSAPLAYLGSDPLSYGLEPNRANLEMITRYAREQHVIDNTFAIDELFTGG
jgi:4,5-dihydroxyphthalate decarboxylase